MTKIYSNKINFVISAPANERAYSLISGEFFVKDHKIASGQPCEVKIGDTLQCNQNGEFDFQVGRKSSKDVSKWFASKCNPKSNTTFGHRAKKLNFAFFGTLRLKIAQVSINEQFVINFDDILIAQKSSGSRSNWWFGGESCSRIIKNVIVSNGSTDDQNHFRFTFLRGAPQSNVHTIEIKQIEFFTWMKTIEENKFLSQINIPGTHDSGTYKFNRLIFNNYVKTQNITIREQLDAGIRFLDIRCRHINNKFAIHHGRYFCNLMFGEVLEQCTAFLRVHDSECIVMSVKEEYKPEGNTREFYQTFLDYVQIAGESYWYRSNTIPRLKDVRNKIVLIHRFNFKQQTFGINAVNWPNNKTFKIQHQHDSIAFWIQDQYSVTWTQKAMAINELANESNKRENFWYLNFISLTPALSSSIRKTSHFTNTIIHDIAKNNKNSFLGLIIMDYPNVKQGLISSIIDNNRQIKQYLYPKLLSTHEDGMRENGLWAISNGIDGGVDMK